MCSWLPARNENLLGLMYCSWFWLEVSKKVEKPIKPRKPEKNNRKNRTVKKKLIKPIKFWKNRPVRFYKPKTEKTELNPNRKKTRKKTEPNRKKLNQTGLNRFCPKKPNRNRSVWTGFGFFINNFSLVTFFYIKTESNRKWSPLILVMIILFHGIFISNNKFMFLWHGSNYVRSSLVKLEYTFAQKKKKEFLRSYLVHLEGHGM